MNKVEVLLRSAKNPLVAISLVGPIQADGASVARAMGVVFEKLGNGLRLVATCKHCFGVPGERTLLAMMANPRPTVLQVIGSYLGDPEEESDIAFLLVEDPVDAPTQPFMLPRRDPEHPPGKFLYSARNDCQPLLRGYDVYTARQAVTELALVPFCKFSELGVELISPNHAEQIAGLEASGFHRCRAFQMVSRQGFSGSPIWDASLTFYGLNVRGSSPGEPVHDLYGDVAICIPASAVRSARARIQPALEEALRLHRPSD